MSDTVMTFNTRAPSVPGDHAAEIAVQMGNEPFCELHLTARMAVIHGQRLLDLGLKQLLKEEKKD